MSRDGFLIGEVARRSGVSRKALRLYEARGLLRRHAGRRPVNVLVDLIQSGRLTRI